MWVTVKLLDNFAIVNKYISNIEIF